MKAFIVLAGICLAASTTSAQTPFVPPRISFGFGLSEEISTGGFAADNSTLQEGISAVAQYQLPMRRLALRADIGYHRFSDPTLLIGPGHGGAELFTPALPDNLWSFSIDLIGRLNDPSVRWSPYMLIGVAAYHINPQAYETVTPSAAGLQAGLGFEVRAGERTFFFIESRYMDVHPGGIVPLTIGMRF